MGRLDNKVAIVTGGGNGIGRTTAALFAREGASVVIAEFDEAAGKDAVKEITAAGGKASFVRTDVTEESSVRAMVQFAVDTYGKLNILHNNAGGSTLRDNIITEVPIEEFWYAIKLNLFGTFLGCRFAIPEMVKAGGGSIINMASSFAIMGVPRQDCYTAAKGGIVSLTRSLAVEYGHQNIKVNAIAPGVTMTDRVIKRSNGDPSAYDLAKKHRIGYGKPLDIAYMALYLASDESPVTTGVTHPVDGGASVS